MKSMHRPIFSIGSLTLKESWPNRVASGTKPVMVLNRFGANPTLGPLPCKWNREMVWS